MKNFKMHNHGVGRFQPDEYRKGVFQRLAVPECRIPFPSCRVSQEKNPQTATNPELFQGR
jgi:hypothetical protein